MTTVSSWKYINSTSISGDANECECVCHLSNRMKMRHGDWDSVTLIFICYGTLWSHNFPSPPPTIQFQMSIKRSAQLTRFYCNISTNILSNFVHIGCVWCLKWPFLWLRRIKVWTILWTASRIVSHQHKTRTALSTCFFVLI